MIEIKCGSCQRKFIVDVSDVFNVSICPYCGTSELKQSKGEDKK